MSANKETNISALLVRVVHLHAQQQQIKHLKYSFSQTGELIVYVKLCFPPYSIDFMCCTLALKGLTIKT